MKLSVCIATYERPVLLAQTLDSLGEQGYLPDEIVISDASPTGTAERVVNSFCETHPALATRYVRSSRKALPWQRWWAFSHSSGDVVLFIDDDVRLAREATSKIVQVFEREDGASLAGVGLIMDLEIEGRAKRDPGSLRERWLATARYPSGAVTPGGLSVSAGGVTGGRIVEAEWLWGGAMAFRRQVLNSIGPLEQLYSIYDKGIGKGEDCVLSYLASRHGKLLLLTDELAIHPDGGESISTANIHQGWYRGVRETFGRAHTMRWTASSKAALRRDWLKVACLELSRSVLQVVHAPLRFPRWQRLAGGLCGAIRTIIFWRAIPTTPVSGETSHWFRFLASSTQSGPEVGKS